MKTATASHSAFTQLCHHLSLDKAGKVQGAVDSLVLTVLAIDPRVGAGDENQVAEGLSTYFGLELPVGQVRKALECHLRGGRLHRSPEDVIRLTPAVCASVQERVRAADELEATVRREWLLEVAARYPDLAPDTLWAALQAYCGNVFRQHGALAVQLLGPDSGAAAPSQGLGQLLQEALQGQGLEGTPGADEAISMFFRSSTTARTRYVSQLLDGTFTFFALSVSDATAAFLRDQLPTTRLFLDTNVVLGMLGLHENPLDEATQELLAFIKKHKLPYQIYYHERTLKELREVIAGASNRLKAQRYSQALSRGVVEWSETASGLSSIERLYHSMNAVQPLDPEVFLSKFDHVEELLGERDVKIYREPPGADDVDTKGQYIAEFEHWLARRRPGKPPRPYAALDHDIVVWMSLQRQRTRGRNPLKTGALLLTNDYGLYDFDRAFLSKKDRSRVASAVLPQQLLQVLRPLVGATSDFDDRFLEVFAASEFRTAQSDYDEAASLVVSYLATYEDVSTETAVRVLSDQVLLAKLRPEEQTDAEFRELIENAVFQDNTALIAEVSEAKGRAEAAEKSRQDLEEEARQAARDAEAAKTQVLALTTEARRAGERAAADRHEADTRVSELERRLQAEQALREEAERERISIENTFRRRLLMLRVGLACLAAVAGLIIVRFLPDWTQWSRAADHDHRLPITLLVQLGLAAGCWLIARPQDRTPVGGVVLASLIAALTLL